MSHLIINQERFLFLNCTVELSDDGDIAQTLHNNWV